MPMTRPTLSTNSTTAISIPARDNPGGAVYFTLPAVVNGRVYVPAQYAVSVFGNAVFLATPVISPNGGIFTNSVTVTLTDATPGVTLYYTLDGTAPTASSPLYTAPFTLTNTANLQVMAAKPGAVKQHGRRRRIRQQRHHRLRHGPAGRLFQQAAWHDERPAHAGSHRCHD